MKSEREGINALAEPSGTGCVECLATGGWRLHLRRCAECGHGDVADDKSHCSAAAAAIAATASVRASLMSVAETQSRH
jgi:hypothetical protein